MGNVHDLNGSRVDCTIIYKGQSIVKKTLIYVDDARCIMHMPLNTNGKEIENLSYILAKIYDINGVLKEYIKRRKFSIIHLS